MGAYPREPGARLPSARALIFALSVILIVSLILKAL